MIKSIDEQIAAMERDYPNLRVVERIDRACVWRGDIRPYHKTYCVEIRYRVPFAVEAFSVLRDQPRVLIRSPILESHPEYDEGPIPHIYINKTEPDYPFLCLFDPYVPEWTVEDFVAETTVPWTERWLINYEFWLATGVWRGGGRHIDQDEVKRIAVAGSG